MSYTMDELRQRVQDYLTRSLSAGLPEGTPARRPPEDEFSKLIDRGTALLAKQLRELGTQVHA